MTGVYFHPAPDLLTSTLTTAAGTAGGGGQSSSGRLPVADGRSNEDVQHARAIGRRIVWLRTIAGLTQRQLAARSGLSLSTVGRWENHAIERVSLDQLRALAAALGVTAGHLIDAGSTSTTKGTETSPAGTRPQPASDVRSGYVLVPTQPPGVRRAATTWRLLHFLPYELGQRWEHPADIYPTRSVSPAVLNWATDLLGEPTTLYGSASELTGQRSWYVGPLHTPTPTTTTRRRRGGRHPDRTSAGSSGSTGGGLR